MYYYKEPCFDYFSNQFTPISAYDFVIIILYTMHLLSSILIEYYNFKILYNWITLLHSLNI